jgi:hypothetical protein
MVIILEYLYKHLKESVKYILYGMHFRSVLQFSRLLKHF